jgi:hypothetical protein
VLTLLAARYMLLMVQIHSTDSLTSIVVSGCNWEQLLARGMESECAMPVAHFSRWAEGQLDRW